MTDTAQDRTDQPDFRRHYEYKDLAQRLPKHGHFDFPLRIATAKAIEAKARELSLETPLAFLIVTADELRAVYEQFTEWHAAQKSVSYVRFAKVKLDGKDVDDVPLKFEGTITLDKVTFAPKTGELTAQAATVECSVSVADLRFCTWSANLDEIKWHVSGGEHNAASTAGV